MNSNGAGRPVFVIGAPRSGTSVLAWALAEHSQFGTSQEAEFNVQLFGRGHLRRIFRRSSRRPDGFLAQHGVDYTAFCRSIAHGIDHLYRSHVPAPSWIDATPRNSLIAFELARAFPEARFIHIIRDGREVVRSLSASGFPTWSARSFSIGCWTWQRFVNCGLDLVRHHPARAMDVRYEHLVSEPDAFWETLFRFLEVEPDSGCARFVAERRINSSFTDQGDESPSNAAQSGPLSGAREVLRRTLFSALCGRTMKRLGYWP